MLTPNIFSGPVLAGQRIGLLGGSFNPAHEGHVAMSRFALKRLRLDQIWWVVSPQNPLKALKSMGSFERRLKEARALVRYSPRIRVTDIEAQLGTCYTVDTIVRLKQRLPETFFVWLMGMDNLLTVDRWQRWETLFQLVPIAVFRRPGYAPGLVQSRAAQRFALFRHDVSVSERLPLMDPPAWTVLDNKYNAMSATKIRRSRQKTPEGESKARA